MTAAQHYMIIGNGLSGSTAAFSLRKCDPAGRITIVTEDSLLYYRLASLPLVFVGQDDWRDFLVYPPSTYADQRIAMRRQSWVTRVDAEHRRVVFANDEAMGYDKLLVATGGAPYLPQHLDDWSDHLRLIYSYEAAVEARRDLPKHGKVIMLGGDMYGIAMGLTLVKLGFTVTLVPYERAFWPHQPEPDELPALFEGVEKLGIEVVNDVQPYIVRIEAADGGDYRRRIEFGDGSEIVGDMIMPFFGTLPAVDFMYGAGVEIQHGVKVDRTMRTADHAIWAVGDACQLAAAAGPTAYIHYSRVDVVRMSEIAARNMTGEMVNLRGLHEEKLTINDWGELESPYLYRDA